MPIYIGGTKCKIISGGVPCEINTYSPIIVTNGVRLLSSDDYVLKDKNNIYLTLKKEDE